MYPNFKQLVDQKLTFKPGGGHPHLQPMCAEVERIFFEFVNLDFGIHQGEESDNYKKRMFPALTHAIQVLTRKLEILFSDQPNPDYTEVVRQINNARMAMTRIILYNGKSSIVDHDYCDLISFHNTYCYAALFAAISSLVHEADQVAVSQRWENYQSALAQGTL